jgi:predicted RNA-binding Zn-ribbon protein involved in translation (DUF1610 family)
MGDGKASGEVPSGEAGGPNPPAARSAEQRCDFCGEVVPRVRRVALDTGYERLQTRHAVRYACPSCSEAKEQSRLGFEPRRRG